MKFGEKKKIEMNINNEIDMFASVTSIYTHRSKYHMIIMLHIIAIYPAITIQQKTIIFMTTLLPIIFS